MSSMGKWMKQLRNVHKLATLAQFKKWQNFGENPTMCAAESWSSRGAYWLVRDFFMQSSASKKLHHVRNSFPSLYSLLILQKGLWKKPWRTTSRFVWFSEVLRFKATLRGDALLFWYASWSHTKSHLVTLTAIPITHRKWSGQKEYFTRNPKGRIWEI